MAELAGNMFSTTFADRDVERAILSAIVGNKEQASFFMDRLSTDDFHYRIHQELYSEI